MSDAPPTTSPSAERILYAGQDAVRLQLSDGTSTTVMHHGAHVVSWHSAQKGEMLYLSPQTAMTAPHAIRGGVPVIFPQFEHRGPDKSVPRHGFARNAPWMLAELHADQQNARCAFKLTDSPQTRAHWPHAFEMELTVALSEGRLDMELYILNTDAQAWNFSAALHTYLACEHLPHVHLEGLEGVTFMEAHEPETSVEHRPDIRITEAIDRIYMRAPSPLHVKDGAKRITVQHEGFEDVVVWNPGAENAARMVDMPNDDWQRMLCVEGAQVMNPPTLGAGQSWTARQSLVLTPDTV